MGRRPGRAPVGGGDRGRRPPRRTQPPGRPRASAAKGGGGEQVEGRHAVRELLIAGKRKVKDIWLADDLEPAPILDDILELAGEARVNVRRVGRTQLEHEARSDAPQGILAHAAALAEADLERLATPRTGVPFLI